VFVCVFVWSALHWKHVNNLCDVWEMWMGFSVIPLEPM